MSFDVLSFCWFLGGRGLADQMMSQGGGVGGVGGGSYNSSMGSGCCGGGSSEPVREISPGYSVCDYAQRRMWGVAQEAGMNMTCGNIIPKVNAYRFSQ